MKLRVLATALIAGSVLFSGLAKADKLDDIKQAGVVRIAIFDSNPPFG
ncbi:amino acid ABC transporter substrate-binding protein, partial [Proteus mirabilis]